MKGANSGRGFQHETDAVAIGLTRHDAGLPIDMAGDEMAAELGAEGKRPLEVDAAAGRPGAKGGAVARLVGDVHLEGRGARGAVGDVHHGETTAVAGNRGAFPETVDAEGRRDAQARAVAGDKRAYVANNAGEHARLRRQ